MARRVVTVTSQASGDAMRRLVGAVPAQPGILHHVLGIGADAQHAVGDGKQAGPQGLEGGGGRQRFAHA